MVVRIEKNGPVWTVIHDRPEARNAMDPESADALTDAFFQFDADESGSVAVLYGAPPGVGKTHLAVAIGRQAILTGYSALFVPAPTLVAQLAKAHSEGRLEDRL